MRVSILLAALLLSTTAAQAQYISKAAASGKPVRLVFANSTNPDCTPHAETTIRLIGAPRHGRVHISKARDFPTFALTNVRSVCNTRRVAGTLARYVSRRGFFGTDHLGIEIIFPSGRLVRRNYVIYVR